MRKAPYFKSNTKDLPDEGLFNREIMAPEIREIAINPGAPLATAAGVAVRTHTINRLRRFAAISNTHATEPVYVKFGPPTGHAVGSGIMLVPLGGSIVFGLNTDLPYTGEVSIISAAISSVAIIEG